MAQELVVQPFETGNQRCNHAGAFIQLAGDRAVAVALVITAVSPAAAQNPQLEEKVAAIRQSIAANKQAVAQYTWQDVETISVKGEVKDTKTYQVQMGPNGQAQKTEVSNDPAQQSGGGAD